MRTILTRGNPPHFHTGNSVRAMVDGKKFTGEVTKLEWLDGGWYYTVDDGSNLVGGVRRLPEASLKQAPSRAELRAALEEVRELIEGYVDVMDSSDGPKPNKAMCAVHVVDGVL